MNLNVTLIDPLYFSAALFIALLLCVYLGHWLGHRIHKTDGDGIGATNGAVFALLGLLLAFTFSGAVSRFDDRRTLTLDEANAVGTAWLRLDLLPAAAQPELRNLFRAYVQARLDTYVKVGSASSFAAVARSQALQQQIWGKAVAAAQASGSAAVLSQTTNALNQMFDLATSQIAVAYFHPPAVVYAMLFFMGCVAALLAGVGLAGRPIPWLQVVIFVLALALTVYVILDLEYPRLGLIRVDAADEILRSVLRSMGPATP